MSELKTGIARKASCRFMSHGSVCISVVKVIRRFILWHVNENSGCV